MISNKHINSKSVKKLARELGADLVCIGNMSDQAMTHTQFPPLEATVGAYGALATDRRVYRPLDTVTVTVRGQGYNNLRSLRDGSASLIAKKKGTPCWLPGEMMY